MESHGYLIVLDMTIRIITFIVLLKRWHFELLKWSVDDVIWQGKSSSKSGRPFWFSLEQSLLVFFLLDKELFWLEDDSQILVPLLLVGVREALVLWRKRFYVLDMYFFLPSFLKKICLRCVQSSASNKTPIWQRNQCDKLLYDLMNYVVNASLHLSPECSRCSLVISSTELVELTQWKWIQLRKNIFSLRYLTIFCNVAKCFGSEDGSNNRLI